MSNLRKNWNTKRANEESMQKWMKLMQNGLFIDEIWAKIAIGTLSYRWNSILAVGSQIESNLVVGSLYYHWNSILVVRSTRAWYGPSNHVGERIDISQNIGNLSSIFWRFFTKNRPFDLSSWNVMSLASNMRYINDISPIFRDIFLLADDL